MDKASACVFLKSEKKVFVLSGGSINDVGEKSEAQEEKLTLFFLHNWRLESQVKNH